MQNHDSYIYIYETFSVKMVFLRYLLVKFNEKSNLISTTIFQKLIINLNVLCKKWKNAPIRKFVEQLFFLLDFL
jgi:hypothetical protein